MMKRLGWVFVLLAAIVSSGCFDYQEDLTIREDGGGTIAMHYSVDRAYLDQMKQMQQEMARMFGTEPPEDLQLFDSARIVKRLGEDVDGVRLLSYKESKTESTYEWDMQFDFDDLNRLYALGEILDPDAIDDPEYAEEVTGDEDMPEIVFEKQGDGSWLYERVFDTGEEDTDEYGEYGEWQGEAGDDAETSDDVSEDMRADLAEVGIDLSEMEQQMKEHVVQFSVTFPGNVVSSNATSFDGRTAVWEYKLTDLQGAPQTMRAVVK